MCARKKQGLRSWPADRQGAVGLQHPIEEAANQHPASEPLIVHAALLAPEPLPLFLFTEAREKFGEPLASALSGGGLDETVATLRRVALIDRG
jgi:hypothetical protein